ncbi:ABC transporter ATP-binding protein [Streptomyces sp. NPDC059679]|uniref:ABC transporter ATP-binding protein n=1 Tax=Streptomyces sp. NPDC059679 TaxID=3346903 RepID=UPI003681974C
MTAAPDTAPVPGPGSPDDVLAVRNLDVTVGGRKLVEDVDFTIRAGERVGLIGESGSGKSLTALSVMGLLPEGLRATGSVRLAGVDHDLVGADEARMSRVRGKEIAMVFQEPMTALNPTMRIGRQIAEVLLIHRTRPDRASARAAAVELLAQVGLPDPAAAAQAYPHQFSGGQRQRVVLAIALANDPALLVCDEPTTALDVTVQARVLDLIVRGVQDRRSAMLFITHDLAVVATACERVMVMYGGRLVESGPVQEVFTRPRHRYTRGLIGASDLTVVDDRGRLATIPGSVPPAGQFPAGCVFRNRCAHATEACATRPEWVPTGPDSGYACFHPASESPVSKSPAAVSTSPADESGAHVKGTPMNQEAGRG